MSKFGCWFRSDYYMGVYRQVFSSYQHWYIVWCNLDHNFMAHSLTHWLLIFDDKLSAAISITYVLFFFIWVGWISETLIPGCVVMRSLACVHFQAMISLMFTWILTYPLGVVHGKLLHLYLLYFS